MSLRLRSTPAGLTRLRGAGPLAAIGAVVCVLALVLVLAGAIPLDAVHDVWSRVWPVLAFLLLIKPASDLVQSSGLFDVLCTAMARAAGGRTWVLLVLVCGLCWACTTVLSLDATAVLLTPLVILLTAQLRLDPEPFLMAVLWLANIASLLLPVSNLTNLLAQERSGWSASQFLSITWRVQLALVAVTILVLLLAFRRPLGGRYVQAADDGGRGRRDTVVIAGTAVLLVIFAAAVVAGAAAWMAALAFDLVLLALLRVRTGRMARPGPRPAALVREAPWSMAAFAFGLFVVMEGLARATAGMLGAALGDGDGVLGLVRLQLIGSASANLVNNLPAYLALESGVQHGTATVALLVAVNAGPIILPWGSLAALLWLTACRRGGIRPSLTRMSLLGLGLVPLLLLTSALVLA